MAGNKPAELRADLEELLTIAANIAALEGRLRSQTEKVADDASWCYLDKWHAAVQGSVSAIEAAVDRHRRLDFEMLDLCHQVQDAIEVLDAAHERHERQQPAAVRG